MPIVVRLEIDIELKHFVTRVAGGEQLLQRRQVCHRVSEEKEQGPEEVHPKS